MGSGLSILLCSSLSSTHLILYILYIMQSKLLILLMTLNQLLRMKPMTAPAYYSKGIQFIPIKF